MELFQKIKLVREFKGVTQTFIANTTGMTVGNYNMKEKGKRTISAKEVETISKALQVPATLFFEENFNEKLNELGRIGKEVC